MIMFKIEDIAMMVKSFSEKRLKKTLDIKDMSFDEDLSKLKNYSQLGSEYKKVYTLYFKIKQTVNREEFAEKISEAVTEECAKSLDLYYDSEYYTEPQISHSFKISEVDILSVNLWNAGIRGNVRYIKLVIDINRFYDNADDIEIKVKKAIRNLKLSQLNI